MRKPDPLRAVYLMFQVFVFRFLIIVIGKIDSYVSSSNNAFKKFV